MSVAVFTAATLCGLKYNLRKIQCPPEERRWIKTRGEKENSGIKYQIFSRRYILCSGD
jgi:hypothetical protein